MRRGVPTSTCSHLGCGRPVPWWDDLCEFCGAVAGGATQLLTWRGRLGVPIDWARLSEEIFTSMDSADPGALYFDEIAMRVQAGAPGSSAILTRVLLMRDLTAILGGPVTVDPP